MPHHEWGDEDFDWDSLYKSQRFIYKWSYRLAGLTVINKEKYGTIRYEFFLGLRGRLWIKPTRFKLIWWWRCRRPFFFNIRYKLFLIVIYFTCCKWPHIAAEIVDDLIVFDSPKIPWYAKRWVKENPWR